jgi:hypothetical protein
MPTSPSFLEALYRHRLRQNPRDTWAAAWLADLLRTKGQPAKAVTLTSPLKNSLCPILQTARAAALCDLGQWKSAQLCLDRAFACGASQRTWQVQGRIEAWEKEEGVTQMDHSFLD